jgi:probable F420-dependent oxidoreductase
MVVDPLNERPTLGIHLGSFAPADPGDWSHIFTRARAADEVGIDRVVVYDHIAFGDNLHAHGSPELGGIAGGQPPTGSDGHWLEPMTVLAAVSSVTSRVRLTTSVLLAALRRPVVLAKTASTLDVLSNGRLDLGVGVGWQREEYEAAGLDFDVRGRLLDESLAVLQTLWRGGPVSFEGHDLTFESIEQMPTPRQAGGVPIWVSGTLNRAVVARVVRFGTGWIPWGPHIADPRGGIERLRHELDDAGRDPAGLKVLLPLPIVVDGHGGADVRATLDPAGRLAAAGVTDFRVDLPVPNGAAAAADYLADVVTRFRTITGQLTPTDR